MKTTHESNDNHNKQQKDEYEDLRGHQNHKM